MCRQAIVQQEERQMVKSMEIGGKHFDIGNHTYIMGILNMTPDSFSDGGSYPTEDAALYQVERMLKEGADIIDVGGESTRPGHVKISDAEEIERIVPIIEKIKANFDVPVSADTYKSAVAKAALMAGADMINDIWGFKYDAAMADVVKQYDAACCLMHNQDGTVYNSFVKDCIEALGECVSAAKKAGIADEKIMIDPGVGFGKDYTQSLLVIKQLERFNSLGYPVLLGTSRKSVIGLTLDIPAGERDTATAATSVFAVCKGAAFVRVHNVAANYQAIKMAEAILSAR